MRDILVICYHAVSESWESSLAVTPESLDRQLAHLRERGYGGATFTRTVLDRPPGRTAVITFDDNFLSVYELAAPILARHGFPGTVFVPTAFASDPGRPMAWPGIDGWLGGPDEDELRPASWAQLRELAGAGWEMGSHTRTHERLPLLSDDALMTELRESRRECEEGLGRPCTSIAYPHGDHDERVIRAAGAAGYEAGATLPSPHHRARPLRWPRIGVHREDGFDVFARKITPARRLLRRNPLWWLAQQRHRLARTSAPS